jgi:hypothetical protein
MDRHNLYFSPNINLVLRSRKMSLAGARGTYCEKRNADRVLVGKLERDLLEHRGINGRIILKCILKK